MNSFAPFNVSQFNAGLIYACPEIFLGLAACAILMLDLLLNDSQRRWTGVLAVIVDPAPTVAPADAPVTAPTTLQELQRRHELLAVFRDLADRKVDILTIGQYLRPSRDHLPMSRFYTPDEFAFLKHEAQQMGFRHVESGPLVRSSYHAHEQAQSTGLA